MESATKQDLSDIRKAKRCYVAIIGRDDTAWLRITKKQAIELIKEHKCIGLSVRINGESAFIDNY